MSTPSYFSFPQAPQSGRHLPFELIEAIFTLPGLTAQELHPFVFSRLAHKAARKAMSTAIIRLGPWDQSCSNIHGFVHYFNKKPAWALRGRRLELLFPHPHVVPDWEADVDWKEVVSSMISTLPYWGEMTIELADGQFPYQSLYATNGPFSHLQKLTLIGDATLTRNHFTPAAWANLHRPVNAPKLELVLHRSLLFCPDSMGNLEDTNISSLTIRDARCSNELLDVFNHCNFPHLKALYICPNDRQPLHDDASISFHNLLGSLGIAGARLHTLVVRRIFLSSPKNHTASTIPPIFVNRLKALELPLANIKSALDLLLISPLEHLTFGVYDTKDVGLLSRLWVCLVRFITGKWKPACTSAHELRLDFANEIQDNGIRSTSPYDTVQEELFNFTRVFSQSELYNVNEGILYFAPPPAVNFGIVVDLTPLYKMEDANEKTAWYMVERGCFNDFCHIADL